jgi:hypothetical protein
LVTGQGAQAPTPTPAPLGSSRENPIPLGQAALVSGSWRIQVLSTIPDATAMVLAENQFNAPPAAGRQFFIARVQATYVGPGSATFDGSFRLRAVGPSAVAYETFDLANNCGVIPDPMPEPDVFTGGTVAGNVCWSILSTDVQGLVMFDEPLAATSRTFFALT